MLYYSATLLGRHPCEMDMEMAAAYEIIWAGRQHDRAWNSRLEAVIKSLAGRML